MRLQFCRIVPIHHLFRFEHDGMTSFVINPPVMPQQQEYGLGMVAVRLGLVPESEVFAKRTVDLIAPLLYRSGLRDSQGPTLPALKSNLAFVTRDSEGLHIFWHSDLVADLLRSRNLKPTLRSRLKHKKECFAYWWRNRQARYPSQKSVGGIRWL